MQRILIIILGVIFLISSAVPSYALGSSELDVDMSSSSNSIDLNWKGNADHYEISSLSDNKITWKGSERLTTISGLEPDHLYKFTLKSFDSDNH
ncbi:fibronectin type III domain-containing protein [Hazenella sp. IB182357]|uniref:Fibronectin type III domain-containing protein n=1 Tax=Polycladospora coralii TaxID=2771432 RepID=A0A926N6N5_9BACL|nr:fibronectin type III domain-containing protein [Polycladospora coralii]MBD1372506.1 fibronectin type III domain-containing protein [Polycladospora coralii]